MFSVGFASSVEGSEWKVGVLYSDDEEVEGGRVLGLCRNTCTLQIDIGEVNFSLINTESRTGGGGGIQCILKNSCILCTWLAFTENAAYLLDQSRLRL